jgi:hypothetical protein
VLSDDTSRSVDVSATARTAQADELERYRRAAEDTMQQLDWCIGYCYGIGKRAEAGVLARNRRMIRTQLLKREEQPVPAGNGTGH